MRADARVRQRLAQPLAEVVDLDRREPHARDAIQLGERADHLGQAAPRDSAIAVEAEVDARHDELAVALRDPPARLLEHGAQRPRAARAAHARDHAERAAERAAVLHLQERPRALEPRCGPDAAGRAELARDALGRLLGASRARRSRGRPRSANVPSASRVAQPVT